MIKCINDGELDRLKIGFYNTIALKKINMLNVTMFMNKELELDMALKIYTAITALGFPICYSGCSEVMMDYLIKNNLLMKDDVDEINKIFHGDAEIDEEKETDDFCDYGDYWDDRNNFIKEFLEELCDEKGIEIHVETFRDILACDDDYIDLDIYGELRTTLRECVGNIEHMADYTDSDWDEEYVSIFQEDATSYVLTGYEMSYYEMKLLTKTFTSSDSGVASEVYTQNGNTFITISDTQIYDGIGYSFLIILKLILIGKLNN
ncbi:hypothetical protein OD350_29335 (plasmid) [Clostridium beijerinckii]|uniref:hypothetical protein n=1 Tax=Clostridium beijerinckii TaxID=1520 RepID=UPI00222668D9|nr:hypothetical protein [Clostridium beijerinckii]UYZ38993.1 hypothetical protein OD350_29335 [Clostridium beijerinckii]